MIDVVLTFLGFDWAKPQVQAGVLSFFGVLITGGIAIITWRLNQAKERKLHADLRAEKRNDLLLAIWSDIHPVWIAMYSQGPLKDKLERVRLAFANGPKDAKGNVDYTPFVTKVSEPLFEARLVNDVDVLENEEIRLIVGFYHHMRLIAQMANDMRSERYEKLPPHRKEAVLRDMFLIEHRAQLEAEETLLYLEGILGLADEKTGARPVFTLKSKMDQAYANQ